ncbi:MAG: class I SAM-dependent methyltransferase [Acidimicrobiales bacterium]
MVEFSDWQPAPNIRDNVALYELENEAFDPEGLVLDAMRAVAPWRGRRLIDLGCGTGYWLSLYAAEAAHVVGVEPDPMLRRVAEKRMAGTAGVTIAAGSAEHLPFPDASVDVVHARFAYFFGPGAERGLAEVLRVLASGGSLVVVDNDHLHGEFAELLAGAATKYTTRNQGTVSTWWRDHGARSVDVLSEWVFSSREDLEAVLSNEFRDGSAEPWLKDHPDRTSLSYGYTIYVVTSSSRTEALR